MAGNQKPPDRRDRTRRKPAERDDWLEQFAPTAPAGSPRAPSSAPAGSPRAPSSAPAGAPDPRSRVPGPRPDQVPGSRGLDAELHQAALRELGLDGPPPAAPVGAPPVMLQPAPEVEPVLDHGMTREDLTDWLEEFAPVADRGEEPEPPRRRTQNAEASPVATDSAPAHEEPEPAWSADPTVIVAPTPPPTTDNVPVATPAVAAGPVAPSPDPTAIIAAPPPVADGSSAKTPDLADILRVGVDDDIVPGTTVGPSKAAIPRPAALPVDWSAPLVWSNDESQDPMSPERPDGLAPMSDLRQLAPDAAPVVADKGAPKTEPDQARTDVEPDTAAWPSPPPLDEHGVPIMTPITNWSPAEPVAWGWAEAWPEGTPADWHTQSLPVTPEPPLVDAPLVQELEEPPVSWADSDSGSEGTGLFDVATPADVPITASASVSSSSDTDQDWTEPAPGFSLPGLPADPELLRPAAPVAWAEDLPLPDDRPAPPPLPGTTNYAGGRLQPANEMNLQWNDAIADQSPDLTAPAPPKEWGSPDFFDASEVVDSPPIEPVDAQQGAGPADFQPDVSPYHDRVTPDGAAGTNPLGSTNVDNPQNIGGSDPEELFDAAPEPIEPVEPLAPLDPGVTDWAPAGLDDPVSAEVLSPPAMAGQTSSLPDPGLPTFGSEVPGGGLGETFGETAGAIHQGTFAPTPDPAVAVAGAPAANFEPSRLEATDLPAGRPQAAPQGTLAQLRANPATRLLLEWVPLLFGAFVVAMLVRFFVFQAYYIPSGSMIPTLEVRDRVLVNKLSYDFHDVNRGDIVVFKRPEGTDGNVDDLIKRVMGLPGETLIFRNGEVYVDGQLVEESYIQEQDSTFPISGIPGCVPEGTSSQCTVPEGSVFVMGDNRRGSTDGRVFGPIDQDTIVGRAFVKVWPIGDFGFM